MLELSVWCACCLCDNLEKSFKMVPRILNGNLQMRRQAVMSGKLFIQISQHLTPKLQVLEFYFSPFETKSLIQLINP